MTILEKAVAEWNQAKLELSSAKTKKARQDAEDSIEFWSNKMAMLQVMARGVS